MSEQTGTTDEILGKLQKAQSVTNDELKALAPQFAPDAPNHAKAYLALSLLCQNVRKTPQFKDTEATEQLVRLLDPIITGDLTETDEPSVTRGISFLTAIFRVDAEVGISILAKDGTLEGIMDTVDISPSPPLALAVATLLAEASGHKKSRAVLSASTRQWLELQSRKSTQNSQLAVASGVARIKLWQGSLADAAEGEEIETPPKKNIDELAVLMQGIVIASNGVEAGYVEAIEGLAYLSADPELKESMSSNSAFLERLLNLIPSRKPTSATTPPSRLNSPLLYGIVTIISNLTGYRPRLSEEQAQMEKLKKMSKVSQTKQSNSQSSLDDDQYVKVRVQRLMKAGVVPKLSTVPSLTDSPAILKNVARALLSIIEDKDNRGLVLQSGGSKALQLIIRNLSPKASGQEALTLPAPLDAIQALGKLSITSSPIQVYGADVGPIYDALRPLSLLVLHSAATQLQQFEGMMALTNVSSISPDFCTRIADLDGLLSRVELLMFEDHTLLRRASMELVCNLVSGSDKAFQKFAGDGTNSAGIKSKLQLILAISDVEDVPTRLAASGCLAVLMNSTSACRMLFELQMEKARFLPIMADLMSPVVSTEGGESRENAGLIHRAGVCVLNLLTQIDDDQRKELISRYREDVLTLQTTLVGLLKRRESIPLPEHVLGVVVQVSKVIVTVLK